MWGMDERVYKMLCVDGWVYKMWGVLLGRLIKCGWGGGL